MQKGLFRLASLALFAISVWMGYTVLFVSFDNHRVTIGPDSVTREVGTVSDPVIHHIDFSDTAYMIITESRRNNRPYFELVAYSTSDGTETRIPIHDMMKEALPEIFRNAANADVIIGEAPDGAQIPEALRKD